VHNEGRTKWWGKNSKHISTLNNTMVVSYLDKDHWSLYILKEKGTRHSLRFYTKVPQQHNIQGVTRIVHIAWALSKGLNGNDTNFATFVNMDTIIPQVFAQKNSWECGHHVVFNLKRDTNGKKSIST
jgi:hypothetical protein